MDRDDAKHWNERYSERSWPTDPSPWLVENIDRVGDGPVLDVAGGTGRNALWLAERGHDVTLLDVSDVAISIAKGLAGERGVPLDARVVDLTVDPPQGLWKTILVFHYLDRNVMPALARAVAPGGHLIGSLATTRNLERNERPPLPYLLGEGELIGLIPGLRFLRYERGWRDDHHEARFVATADAG